MFSDQVDIEVAAGKGGDGALSFRHEKYRAKGGPDGGDGGRGGNVILQVDHNLNTLSRFKASPRVTAEAGSSGGTNRKHGKSGQDAVEKVPVGTQVIEDGRLVADLARDGEEFILARGGRGGFGNAHFTASTRQTPRLAELGEPGENRRVTLELKLVADIGLVGLPNSGKSTLLSVVSNAKPEIADYPFTTLIPNLGVAEVEGVTMLVADIPGLIEGASEGKGLGDDFLRHIERTAVLLHLIDAAESDPVADWRVINRELSSYQVDLTAKPQLLVLTKSDTVLPDELKAKTKLLKAATKQTVYIISAQAHRGLNELLRSAAKLVLKARAERVEAEEAKATEITEINLPDAWMVEAEAPRIWRVSGERLEGFGRRTDWSNPDAVLRIREILHRTGVAKELRRQGAKPGDVVKFGSHELPWVD